MPKILDFTGKVFGHLTVLQKVSRPDLKSKCYSWLCRCECGKEVSVLVANLMRRPNISCGCMQHPIDKLIGQRIPGTCFQLLALSDYGGKNKHRRYLCLCDCGEKFEIRADEIGSPKRLSCGCYGREQTSKMNRKRIGPLSPRWKPDLDPADREGRRRYQSHAQKIWREKVFERDKYSCIICQDDTGGNLTAHHLNSWDEFKDQRWIVENGATTCKDCHDNFHLEFGYGHNTRDQFEKFQQDRLPRIGK